MTREEVKRLLPIIQAFVDGKKIQYRLSTSIPRPDNRDVSYLKELFDLDEDKFDGFCFNGTINYRIKQETKYRPFKSQEECWNEMLKHHPFGYIKEKAIKNIFFITEININSNNELYFCLSNSTSVYGSVCLFDSYTFVDGKPFGIKEE